MCFILHITALVALVLSSVGVGIFGEHPKSGRNLTWVALAFLILAVVLWIIVIVVVIVL